MAKDLSRRDFLKYAATAAGSVGGIGAIATDGIAQQPSSNASRRFIDALVSNLYTPKVIFRDGTYSVRTEGIDTSNPEQAVREDFFTIEYTPKIGNKPELLVAGVEIHAAETPTQRYRFENVGLRDVPTRVISIMSDGKEVPIDIQNLPKLQQEAHRREYERILTGLTNYLIPTSAQVKPKK